MYNPIYSIIIFLLLFLPAFPIQGRHSGISTASTRCHLMLKTPLYKKQCKITPAILHSAPFIGIKKFKKQHIDKIKLYSKHLLKIVNYCFYYYTMLKKCQKSTLFSTRTPAIVTFDKPDGKESNKKETVDN